MTKQEVKDSLGRSWNGTAKNGTEFTQWYATEDFWGLWKASKQEVKSLNFSVYKTEEGKWLVTLFGSAEGDFENFEAYEAAVQVEREKQAKAHFEAMRDSLISLARGVSSGTQRDEKIAEALVEELEGTSSIDELWDYVQREAEDPDRMWEEAELNC